MLTKIKCYKTQLSIREFNDGGGGLKIDEIADGLGICFSYSNEFPNVVHYMPVCEKYNSIIMSIYKSIEARFSLHKNPTENSYLNIIIFIEKQYIINLLSVEDTNDFEILVKNSKIEENRIFQKKCLDISKRVLQNLEFNLFYTKIPLAYIKSWVHQYLYELAYESYETLYLLEKNNFKQDDIEKVRQLKITIENTPYKAIPSINQMSELLGMSPSKFKKVFKDVFGQSTHQYILDIKAEQAKKIIATNKFSISQIAYKLGFNHPSSLTRLIKNKYKVSPLKIGAKKEA